MESGTRRFPSSAASLAAFSCTPAASSEATGPGKARCEWRRARWLDRPALMHQAAECHQTVPTEPAFWVPQACPGRAVRRASGELSNWALASGNPWRMEARWPRNHSEDWKMLEVE